MHICIYIYNIGTDEYIRHTHVYYIKDIFFFFSSLFFPFYKFHPKMYFLNKKNFPFLSHVHQLTKYINLHTHTVFYILIPINKSNCFFIILQHSSIFNFWILKSQFQFFLSSLSLILLKTVKNNRNLMCVWKENSRHRITYSYFDLQSLSKQKLI